MHTVPRRLSYAEGLAQIRSECDSTGVCMFVGAGVSVDPPCGAPTWKNLVEGILSSAIASHPSLTPIHDYAGDRLLRLKPELLCQILHDTLGADFYAFLDVLLSGRPNDNHLALAALAEQKRVKLILTTNFDNFVEEAFEQSGLSVRSFVGLNPRGLGRLARSPDHFDSNSSCPIVKLHGSLRDRASIVVMLRHAALDLPKETTSFLHHVLQYWPLVLVGYSGNDDDIFPALLNGITSARAVYWIVRENESPPMRRLAEQSARCSLIHSGGKPILRDLAAFPTENESPMVGGDPREEFLNRWARGVSYASWANFYCGAILSQVRWPSDRDRGNPDIDWPKADAQAVADCLEQIPFEAMSPSELAKAHENYGLAQAALGDDGAALSSLSRAVDIHRHQGAWRQVAEVIAKGTASVQTSSSWKLYGIEADFLVNFLAGKTYESYTLGLASLASGIVLLREDRLELACDQLMLACGYAGKSGDRVTLRTALRFLGETYERSERADLARECNAEAQRLERELVTTAPPPSEASPVLVACERKRVAMLRRLVVGEFCLFAIVCTISAILAWLVSPWSMTLAAAYGAGKLWTLSQRFRIPASERS